MLLCVFTLNPQNSVYILDISVSYFGLATFSAFSSPKWLMTSILDNRALEQSFKICRI